MNLKLVSSVSIVIVVLIAVFLIINDQTNNIDLNSKLNDTTDSHNQLLLSAVTIPDEMLQQILNENNVLGFGYLWFVNSSQNNIVQGILTNVHSQNGNILEYWHNELVITNYDQTNSFCVLSQQTIGEVDVTNDAITAKISDIVDISKKYFKIKMISDSRCDSGILAIILE